MSELKKCPFCGGEAVTHVSNGVSVICIMCGAHSKTLVDSYSQGKPTGCAVDKVVKAWNNRKPVEDVMERLKKELNSADAEKERCLRENPLQFDSAKGYARGMSDAIEIIKEELM